MLQLGICFKTPEIETLYRNAGFQDESSSGFDVVATQRIHLAPFEYFQIPLGIVVKPPKDFHCLVLPRSSTFKRYRILMANSMGLIDQNYCGLTDEWSFPAVYIPDPAQGIEEDTFIEAGTRIGQFIIEPVYRFETYRYCPPEKSRGGLGSTGV